jgi:CIC family chloride channel protein
VASVTGYLVARTFTPTQLGIFTGPLSPVLSHDLLFAGLLGVIAASFGIAIMRGVAACEILLSKAKVWAPLRPAVGGLVVGSLALITPQVMSSGHGALELSNMIRMPLAAIGMVFVLKAIASIVSLGSGFRGGLFFASLLLGALGGHLFAAALIEISPGMNLDANVYSIVGMSALSASVIGGPLTMSFIALESTGDLGLTTAVLVAVMVSTLLTRELFGYSFATWRLHLRGETIRSAADVGWIRDLTVESLMRKDVVTVPISTSMEAFRKKFPIGSKTQVIVVDDAGGYLGLAIVADAYRTDKDHATADFASIVHSQATLLIPSMNVRQAVAAFDATEAESLAVVDPEHQNRVIGVLTEAHALRRYAEESERQRGDLLGGL